MGFSTYDIVDFSIAAALDRCPGKIVNVNAIHVLKDSCDAFDIVNRDGEYDLKTDVDKSGAAIVELLDPDTEEVVRRCRVDHVLVEK